MLCYVPNFLAVLSFLGHFLGSISLLQGRTGDALCVMSEALLVVSCEWCIAVAYLCGEEVAASCVCFSHIFPSFWFCWFGGNDTEQPPAQKHRLL